MFWNYTGNSKDQSELIPIISMAVGPGKHLLCQELTYYVFDSDKVGRCPRDQGFSNESTEKCRSILTSSMDVLIPHAEHEL